jgi:hypothetical protein
MKRILVNIGLFLLFSLVIVVDLFVIRYFIPEFGDLAPFAVAGFWGVCLTIALSIYKYKRKKAKYE